MKVVCAWCKQEGREGLLGECEPFDDPTETHGICIRHSEKMLEQLPSVAFPGVRILFVVRRAEIGLYAHLTRSFTGLPYVEVILDRRLRERRRAPVAAATTDRRRANRRIRRARFSSLGYLVVRFGPERPGPFSMEPRTSPRAPGRAE